MGKDKTKNGVVEQTKGCKICFCCITLFQIFLSCLMKRAFFETSDAYMELYISSKQAESVGSLNTVELGKLFTFENVKVERYDIIFIFSQNRGSLTNFHAFKKADKKAIVYEGITSFQLKNWLSNLNILEELDLFDEIWSPDKRLMLDEEYRDRARLFDFVDYLSSKDVLKKCCDELNRIFNYIHSPLKFDILFFDRYYTIAQGCLSEIEAQIFLSSIESCFAGKKLLIKKHPIDSIDKYSQCESEILTQFVPWELVYMNRLVNEEVADEETYLIFNSASVMNNAFIFGERRFNIICINGLLCKYTDIDKTYMNNDVTEQILRKFSNIYGINIKFIDNFGDLYGTGFKGRQTDSALWLKAEERLSFSGKLHIAELRNYRLSLDALLLKLNKKQGSYFIKSTNRISEKTVSLLKTVLPSYAPSNVNPDFGVICDFNEEPTTNLYIHGLGLPTSEEQMLKNILAECDSIYIWGTAKTNVRTFNFLRKAGLLDKVKYVFSSYETGFHNGFAIRKFSKSIVDDNSMIIVCAGDAYEEIGAILKADGFRENVDYMKGYGLQ